MQCWAPFVAMLVLPVHPFVAFNNTLIRVMKPLHVREKLTIEGDLELHGELSYSPSVEVRFDPSTTSTDLGTLLRDVVDRYAIYSQIVVFLPLGTTWTWNARVNVGVYMALTLEGEVSGSACKSSTAPDPSVCPRVQLTHHEEDDDGKIRVDRVHVKGYSYFAAKNIFIEEIANTTATLTSRCDRRSILSLGMQTAFPSVMLVRVGVRLRSPTLIGVGCPCQGGTATVTSSYLTGIGEAEVVGIQLDAGWNWGGTRAEVSVRQSNLAGTASSWCVSGAGTKGGDLICYVQ